MKARAANSGIKFAVHLQMENAQPYRLGVLLRDEFKNDALVYVTASGRNTIQVPIGVEDQSFGKGAIL
jgi:hypothetical protein